MHSSFFGFNVAVSGLFTSQKGLNITNHNIANANTPGYSRQVAKMVADTPMSMFDGTGMMGTGSTVTEINRIRDKYLDYRYWNENVSLGEWETKQTALSDIESIFNEPSDSGFGVVLDEFFTSLQDLSKNCEDDGVRAQVKQKGVSICKYFNNTAANFKKLQDQYNYSVKLKVREVNTYAHEIANLNELIYKAEADGNKANDLRDQRDLAIDKLSKIVNVEASEVTIGTLPNGKKDKKFRVSINGLDLVDNFDANEIECFEIDDDSHKDGMFGIRWKNNNQEIEPQSGELKGYLDIRDGRGINGEFKGVPYYMNKIDEFVRNFAKAFNEGILKDGTKKYAGNVGGVGMDGSTGIRFFTYDNKSSKEFTDSKDIDTMYENINALNISVSSDIQNDVRKIATASKGGEKGNNENIDSLLALRHETSMFGEGSPEDYMKTLVSDIGIDCQYANRTVKIKENVMNQIENRRKSVSEVSLNEEFNNMIKYQHSYMAAAKMINVINHIYDVLINGVAGN